MGLFKNKKKGAPPHTWYPEILHWQEEDEIRAFNVERNWFYATFFLIEEPQGLEVLYLYKGLTYDGLIVLEEKETGLLHKVDFYKFIKRARNLSLKNRSINQTLNQSKEYMELISEFQTAFSELSDSDKPKLPE